MRAIPLQDWFERCLDLHGGIARKIIGCGISRAVQEAHSGAIGQMVYWQMGTACRYRAAIHSPLNDKVSFPWQLNALFR